MNVDEQKQNAGQVAGDGGNPESSPPEEGDEHVNASLEAGEYEDFVKLRQKENDNVIDEDPVSYGDDGKLRDGVSGDSSESKQPDDPDAKAKGEESEDSTTGDANKDSQSDGDSPKWVNRRVNKAVKKAIGEQQDQIDELHAELDELRSAQDDGEAEDSDSDIELPEEPQPDDFEDGAEYVKALSDYYAKMGKVRDAVKAEQTTESEDTEVYDDDDDDEPLTEEEVVKEYLERMNSMQVDLFGAIDEHAPEIRDDIKAKLREEKIQVSDAMFEAIMELGESRKIVNVFRHFNNDPLLSRNIWRMDEESQEDRIADLADTEPPQGDDGVKRKPASQSVSVVETVGGGRSDSGDDAIYSDDTDDDTWLAARRRQEQGNGRGGFVVGG